MWEMGLAQLDEEGEATGGPDPEDLIAAAGEGQLLDRCFAQLDDEGAAALGAEVLTAGMAAPLALRWGGQEIRRLMRCSRP